ncbi:hypothetical protein [Herbiconiux ginsengi]|uniref:Uncharacterized protein n=1 Tax=Herbiconiux ginsengi TaxID=381665 RepID=A0A1H3PSE8_9MICO|nr:hypothetical protein [Herbiconiux ginsengi]SDZ04212.1 hypothetical protein SAMN05216554_2084 [Herbiconiux ginsengi]
MILHTTPAQIAAQFPLRSDADLIELVSALIGEAGRRQLWLMFIDGENRPLPLIVPCAGFPDDPPPDELATFGARACEIAGLVGASAIVLTWERPGGPALDDAERRMVAAIVAGITGGGVAVRGSFLSHSDGVVQLTEKAS